MRSTPTLSPTSELARRAFHFGTVARKDSSKKPIAVRFLFATIASMAITRRQKEVLDFLSGFTSRNGYSPSYEEIAAGLGLNSLATVHKHVTNLQSKGLLQRAHNRSRSIDVLPQRGARGVVIACPCWAASRRANRLKRSRPLRPSPLGTSSAAVRFSRWRFAATPCVTSTSSP